MTKIETTYLWIVGITDFIKKIYIKIKRIYIKAFPAFAVIIGGTCGLGLLEGWADGKVQREHIPYIYGTVIAFTALAIFWFALTYKDKLRAKRGYYERKERR